MERIINKKLTWYLDSNGLITNMQARFLKLFNPSGNLHQRSLHKKTSDGNFFFDLEKAYDTTWNYGIMQDIWSGIKRKAAAFHPKLSLPKKLQGTHGIHSFWPEKSRGWYSKRKYPISYSFLNRNQQYCQLPLPPKLTALSTSTTLSSVIELPT